MAKNENAVEKKSSSTVTVASKLPNPYIMRIFDMVEVDEPVMGGGMRSVKRSQELNVRFTVHGCSHPQNMAPLCEIVGGYALTHNIPKDFWDKWLNHNKESAMVKNHIVMAYASVDGARDLAKDHKDQRSGLERLSPKDVAKAGVKTDIDLMNKEQVKKLAEATETA